MRTFAIALACVGITLIVANELLHAQSREPEIIYKYVPRDLDTYLKDPENQPMAMYTSMFTDESVRTY